MKILAALSEIEFDILVLYQHKTLCTSNSNKMLMKAKHETRKYGLCIISPSLPQMNITSQLQVLWHEVRLLASTMLSCLSGAVINGVS